MIGKALMGRMAHLLEERTIAARYDDGMTWARHFGAPASHFIHPSINRHAAVCS